MFYVDGVQWPYPVSVSRSADIRASDVSGQMMDGTYYRDVVGTFMSYTVRVAVPLSERQRYTSTYDKLIDPVDAHEFILPDSAGGSITFTGYTSNVSDVYVRMADGTPYWRGVQFDVTANVARKRKTYTETIERGRTIFPDVAEHNEGDQWTWTDGAWALTKSYTSADSKYY